MKKLISSILVCTSLLTFTILTPTKVLAAAKEVQPEQKTTTSQEDSAKEIAGEFTLQEAIDYTLKHSLEIKQIDLTVREKAEAEDKADYYGRQLKKGENTLDRSQNSLNEAKANFNNIVYDNLKNQVQNNDDYKALAPIVKQLSPTDMGNTDSIKAKLQGAGLGEQEVKTILGAVEGVKKGVQNELDKNSQAFLEGRQSLKDGIYEATQNLISAGVTTTDNLMSANDTANLMTTSASLAHNIAKTGVLIQKQGLALQTQNAYYEVLEKQRQVKVKEDSLKLAEKIYQFSKDSYSAGLSAKDDYLLASLQVKASQMKLSEAKYNLLLAENSLKRIMNYRMDGKLQLKDNFVSTPYDISLEEGLNKGTTKRLEILKASAEFTIAKLNLDVTSSKYPSNTFYYKEALLQKEQAELNLQRQKNEIIASIYNSYGAVDTTQEVLLTSKDMEKIAKENLEIATYKYEAGFGENSKLLKQMDTEILSGTMAEVLAAQEKVSEVQSAVVSAIYKYNLALAKYNFDIANY